MIYWDSMSRKRLNSLSWPVPFSQIPPESPLTLLGAGAVGVGPRVGRVFRVPRGSALFSPVKVVGVVLSEKANVPILKATVELSCQNKQQKEFSGQNLPSNPYFSNSSSIFYHFLLQQAQQQQKN